MSMLITCNFNTNSAEVEITFKQLKLPTSSVILWSKCDGNGNIKIQCDHDCDSEANVGVGHLQTRFRGFLSSSILFKGIRT